MTFKAEALTIAPLHVPGGLFLRVKILIENTAGRELPSSREVDRGLAV